MNEKQEVRKILSSKKAKRVEELMKGGGRNLATLWLVRELDGREVVSIFHKAVAFTGRCSSKVGVRIRTEESLENMWFSYDTTIFHPLGCSMERQLISFNRRLGGPCGGRNVCRRNTRFDKRSSKNMTWHVVIIAVRDSIFHNLRNFVNFDW